MVELNGVRCGWTIPGWFSLKRGILAPMDGKLVTSFAIFGERGAVKAIGITNRIVGKLRGSMVDEMPVVENVITAGEKKIVPFVE